MNSEREGGDTSPPHLHGGAFTDWLRVAEAWTSEAGAERVAWLRRRPVLLVGLGSTGKHVLEYIAGYLCGRCGDDWYTRVPHIRLLHIGVVDRRAAQPGISRHSLGFSSLSLSLGDEQKQRIAWHAGMRWFDRSRLAAPGRATGRLALFADLVEGKAQSQLWSALDANIADMTDLSVYIIADAFSNDGSGIIADIAHLLKQISRTGQIGRLSLCLALQNARWSEELGPNKDLAGRTFATLRELQRLQRGAPQHWRYAPDLGQPELDTTTEGRLFDDILVFDGQDEQGYDLSGRPAHEGLLPSLAACLIALLDRLTSERFYELWANQSTLPLRQHVPLETVAGAMGAYSLRLPIGEMRRVIEGRLIHQLLFDCDRGLIGWEGLDDQGQPQQRGQVAIPRVGQADIADFLAVTQLSRQGAPGLVGNAVRRHVCDYLERRLNRSGGPSLRWGIAFIAELTQTFPGWRGILTTIEQAMRAWIAAVEEAENDDKLLQSLLDVKAQQAGPLYRAWQAEREQSRALLDRAAHVPSHHLFWRLEDEARLFGRDIVPHRPLERMRERLRWRWFEQQGTPWLGLVILPSDLDRPDPRDRRRNLRQAMLQNPAAFAYTPEKPRQLLGALRVVAEVLSRGLRQQKLEAFVAGDVDRFCQLLARRASPLCRRRQLNPQHWPIAPESFRFFTGPDLDSVRAIAERLRTIFRPGLGPNFHFQELTSESRTECCLLHVKYTLPIHAIDAYTQARSKYQSQADLHVWREEQIAAAWEERASNKLQQANAATAPSGSQNLLFSPRLVELLARAQDALRLFGQALVYSVLHVDLSSLVVSSHDKALASLLVAFPESAERCVALLQSTPAVADALKRAILAARPQDAAMKAKLLGDLCEEAIRPLGEDDQPDAQDLALLLAAIVAEEEKDG